MLTWTVAVAVALSMALVFWSADEKPACTCGPTYCLLPEEGYLNRLAAKKKLLTEQGYPARLISLFDQLDQCEASISTSPTGFSIFRKLRNGETNIGSWTEENEANGATAVLAGELAACYVIISRHAFACCDQPSYDARHDYDKLLDLSKKATTECRK